MVRRSRKAQLADTMALEKAVASGAVSQFVSVKQAASLLQVSQRTVRRLIASGELPAYRLHDLIRIRWRDVLWLLERG